MYAIVEAGGRQVRVSPGETVCIDRVAGDPNTEIVMDKVLMVSRDDNSVWGKPYVEGASVKAEIIEEGRADKVLVFGPRPKKCHRKLRGHRQFFTKVKIKEIVG
jgi:large subunit ribosomal protein L21